MSNINNKDSSTEWNCKEDVGCVPPRRQNLNMERLDNENEDSVPDFMKKTFYLAAAGEGKKLREKHDESCDEFCDAWNRSLADYKDIFQGKDMWNDGKYGEAKNHIKNAFGDMNNRKAMLNEIEKGIKDETFSRENGLDVCKSQCEERSRDDTEDQFLRFFAEWEEEFCDGLNKHEEQLKSCTKDINCDIKCSNFKDWLETKKDEYDIQSRVFEKKYANDNKSKHLNYLKEGMNKCKVKNPEMVFKSGFANVAECRNLNVEGAGNKNSNNLKDLDSNSDKDGIVSESYKATKKNGESIMDRIPKSFNKLFGYFSGSQEEEQKENDVSHRNNYDNILVDKFHRSSLLDKLDDRMFFDELNRDNIMEEVLSKIPEPIIREAPKYVPKKPVPPQHIPRGDNVPRNIDVNGSKDEYSPETESANSKIKPTYEENNEDKSKISIETSEIDRDKEPFRISEEKKVVKEDVQELENIEYEFDETFDFFDEDAKRNIDDIRKDIQSQIMKSVENYNSEKEEFKRNIETQLIESGDGMNAGNYSSALQDNSTEIPTMVLVPGVLTVFLLTIIWVLVYKVI